MGRTEADRQVTREPWSSLEEANKDESKPLLWSEGIGLLEKRLTEPTLLEMSGDRCQLNRSMQHHLIS